MARVVTGRVYPKAARAAPKAATYPMVITTLPPIPITRRRGLPTTHSTRGHTWRRVGPSFSHSQLRTGGTTSSTTVTSTATIASVLTAAEGTDKVPAEPVTRAIATSSSTVETNWETCTSVTVATASDVTMR